MIQTGQEILDDFIRQNEDTIKEKLGFVPGWYELSQLVRKLGKKFNGIDDMCFYLALSRSEKEVRRFMARVLEMTPESFPTFEYSLSKYWKGQKPNSAFEDQDDADDFENSPYLSAISGRVYENRKFGESADLKEAKESSQWKKQQAMRTVENSTDISGYEPITERSQMRSLCNYCRPIYGDEIVGTVTEQGHVTLHRSTCAIPETAIKMSQTAPAMQSLTDPEEFISGSRVIPASWTSMEKNRVYPVEIEVKARDRRFLLSDASIVVSAKAFITDTWSKTIGTVAVLRYSVEMSDLHQLEELVAAILAIEGVFSCDRING